MKYFPYQIVAVTSLMIAFFVGALLQSGADYLRAASYRDGQADILVNMPLKTLSTIDVSGRDV